MFFRPMLLFYVEVCLLPKEPGSCADYEAKWYFEPVTGVCRRFLYGGCGGNANRFDTAEACWDRCVDSSHHDISSTLTPRPTSAHVHDHPQSTFFCLTWSVCIVIVIVSL